ncbi:hypothetical protein P8452_69527 [Trifolium repens]|nr:hypothetical protein P8452_69527 [Trifolium repens]
MLSTWSNKEDCCNWRGVHCDINGRVTNLSLPCFTDDFIIGSKKNKTHCLEGKFHLTLFELEFLNYLDLSNNDFKAIHLPMDCQNKSLVNSPHVNRNFSNVVHLDLSENENLLIDDLRWLLRLSSSLQYLNLNFVDLHKETRWLQILTMFPSLSKLQLSNCLLESVNPSLLYANFTSLEYLDLSVNDFLSEFPIWLFNISGLSYLDLRSNHFHGQISKTLLNLRNMDSLFLGDNMFSGKIPKCLGQLGGLKILGLSYNSFTGSIPTTLGNLSSLTVLRVASNHLTGTLPECFGQLSNLEELDVRGKFHLALFELEFLNYLDLSNNDLKAIHLPIDCKNLLLVKTPHGSRNFSNVVHLDLSENENLVIDDLRWLLRLSSSLKYLNLNFVDLHKETRWLHILTMFPSLSELHLLESVNPSLLYANFTSLEYIDLSGNDFLSEFPIWLFNISGLSYLDLRTNRFHGQIPKTLLNLRNLDSLLLGENRQVFDSLLFKMVLMCTLSLQCGNHHVKALNVLRISNGHNLYFIVAFNYGV